jgi:peptide deformylase
MSILPIRLYPDSVLRAKCREVEDLGPEFQRLVESMIDTMHAAPGIGLAAPQVGVDLRLAVVDLSVGDDPEGLLVLVNPRIVERKGEESEVEGCLSLPGITDKVERPTWILVEALDRDGSEIEIEAEDLMARAICHELDHLDGVLFTDHLRGLRRERAKRSLKKLAEEQELEVPA